MVESNPFQPRPLSDEEIASWRQLRHPDYWPETEAGDPVDRVWTTIDYLRDARDRAYKDAADLGDQLHYERYGYS